MSALAQMALLLEQPWTLGSGPYVVEDDTFVHYSGPSWDAAHRTFGRLVRRRPQHPVMLRSNGHVAKRYEPKEGAA